MLAGKEQECHEYLVDKLAPGLARLGFRFSQVWFTVWGNSPQIEGGGEVDDMQHAQRIFLSDEWEKLASGLEPLTSNFRLRIVNTSNETIA